MSYRKMLRERGTKKPNEHILHWVTSMAISDSILLMPQLCLWHKQRGPHVQQLHVNLQFFKLLIIQSEGILTIEEDGTFQTELLNLSSTGILSQMILCFGVLPHLYPLDVRSILSSCDNQNHFHTLPRIPVGHNYSYMKTTALRQWFSSGKVYQNHLWNFSKS